MIGFIKNKHLLIEYFCLCETHISVEGSVLTVRR